MTQAQATCEPGWRKHKHKCEFLFLAVASSRFTRGLCLHLWLCSTCKPAYSVVFNQPDEVDDEQESKEAKSPRHSSDDFSFIVCNGHWMSGFESSHWTSIMSSLCQRESFSLAKGQHSKCQLLFISGPVQMPIFSWAEPNTSKNKIGVWID